jgi:hypothetical protein
LSKAAKAAMGGLLAAILFAATFLSASHTLHQLLHQANSPGGHSCLVCSFVKGQVSAADVGLLVAVLVLSFFCGLRLVSSFWQQTLDYRLSPSRAPPAR